LTAAAVSSAPALAGSVPASDVFVKSVLSVDTTAHTATFPLHRGVAKGKPVWFVVTDASDAGAARRLGVVFAPSLAHLGPVAIRPVTYPARSSCALCFEYPGAPDFTPARSYVASAGGFPPKSAQPGAIADDQYSPFVRVPGLGVLNAPIVAVGDGPFDVTHHTNTHDRVLAIDTKAMTVTLALARGFVDGKPVYYASTEASDPVAAAVERATYVSRLAKASESATIPIGVVANGPQQGNAPQGLAYLALRTPLSDDATAANAATLGSPFNVLAFAPDLAHPYADNAYSPLWAVHVVGAAQSKRLTSYAEIAALSQPAGFVVNCPAIALGDSSHY
jgi:hypothetical protein